MPKGLDTSRSLNRRPPSRDMVDAAYRARTHGGRILANKRTGEMHIVSPSGSKWNSYDQQVNHLRGGDLSRVGDQNDIVDITDRFDGDR
jgi:hypothetical protein